MRGFFVLIVEDDPQHARLVSRGFSRSGARDQLTVVPDAETALDVLKEIRRSDPNHPDVVMLDLQLPGLSGLELLSIMKSDPALRAIPVIVVSSISDRAAVEESYNRGANCVLSKAAVLADTAELARGIRRFWWTRGRPLP